MSCNDFKVPLDPSDDMDYMFNWAEFLYYEDDTIATSVITISTEGTSAGLEQHDVTLVDASFDIKDDNGNVIETITVIDGGVQVFFKVNAANQEDGAFDKPGTVYDITSKITLASARIKNQTRGLRVRQS